MPDISQQLIQLRKELGFTQKELANLVGIDQTMISDYELGKFIPTQKTINKFAKQGIAIDLDSNRVVQVENYQINKEEEMVDIAKEIIKLRENLELNQSAFARKIGVSPTTLCEIESGKRLISTTTLRKIKDKTGVDLYSSISSTNIDLQQKKETMTKKVGQIKLYFSLDSKLFELEYSSRQETDTTFTYNLILNRDYCGFINFLISKNPSIEKNLKQNDYSEVLLLISWNKTNYFYTLQIKGVTTIPVPFKASKFEDKLMTEIKEDKVIEVIETNTDRDILILCQKIIQIRDLFNELLEQAEAVVQPIADKAKKEEEKKELKVVEVVHKVWKQQFGFIGHIYVGNKTLNDEILFKLPFKSEEECKEGKNYWQTYYPTFIYQTTTIYDDGSVLLGEKIEFTPTNKIQEIQSPDRKGVIGYVEHKAGIVEVIYYDRFAD